MGALRGPGFLGTGASLLADITLIVEILFFLVLCAGVAAQLSKKYAWHDRLQIPVVVLNLFFIGFVMLPSMMGVVGELPAGLGRPPVWVSSLHGLLGLLAQGLAIYCLLAGTAILPRKFGVLRYWMRATFALWTITILFGIGVYITWYTGQASAGPLAGEHDADLAAEHAAAVTAEPAAPSPTAAVVVSEHAEEAVAVDATATQPAAPSPTAAALVSEHAEESAPAEPAGATPAPAPGPAGWLRFSDDQVHNDRVILQLSGVTPPAAGASYEAWLQGQAAPPASIGRLTVNAGAITHTFTDPAGRDLANLYSGVFVTVEPANDTDPAPSGQVAFAGQLPPATGELLRGLISSTRPGVAFAAWNRAGRVLQLAEAQQDYVTSNDLANLRIHAENTLNIIEGAQGANYGDLDGDGAVTTDDPADAGLLSFAGRPGYLELAAGQAARLAQAPGVSADAPVYLAQLNVAADNARQWTEQIRDLELEILQAPGAAAAAQAVTRLGQLAQALFAGQDVDGDGQVVPLPGEGGVKTMVEQAQALGSIVVLAGPAGSAAPAAQPTAELVGEHAAEPAAPTPAAPPPATLAPPPTATPAPPPTATAAPAPPTPTPTIELISEHDGS